MLSEVENEDATMYKSQRKLLQLDVTNFRNCGRIMQNIGEVTELFEKSLKWVS